MVDLYLKAAQYLPKQINYKIIKSDGLSTSYLLQFNVLNIEEIMIKVWIPWQSKYIGIGLNFYVDMDGMPKFINCLYIKISKNIKCTLYVDVWNIKENLNYCIKSIIGKREKH